MKKKRRRLRPLSFYFGNDGERQIREPSILLSVGCLIFGIVFRMAINLNGWPWSKLKSLLRIWALTSERREDESNNYCFFVTGG